MTAEQRIQATTGLPNQAQPIRQPETGDDTLCATWPSLPIFEKGDGESTETRLLPTAVHLEYGRWSIRSTNDRGLLCRTAHTLRGGGFPTCPFRDVVAELARVQAEGTALNSGEFSYRRVLTAPDLPIRAPDFSTILGHANRAISRGILIPGHPSPEKTPPITQNRSSTHLASGADAACVGAHQHAPHFCSSPGPLLRCSSFLRIITSRATAPSRFQRIPEIKEASQAPSKESLVSCSISPRISSVF